MKVINPFQTERQAINEAFTSVFRFLGIPESDRQEARNWNCVIHKVSDVMMDKLKGRPYPIKKGKIFVPKEMLRSKSPFFGIYKPKLKTDLDKLKYLQNLYKNGLSYKVYMELSEVLKVPKEKIYNINIGMRLIESND